MRPDNQGRSDTEGLLLRSGLVVASMVISGIIFILPSEERGIALYVWLSGIALVVLVTVTQVWSRGARQPVLKNKGRDVRIGLLISLVLLATGISDGVLKAQSGQSLWPSIIQVTAAAGLVVWSITRLRRLRPNGTVSNSVGSHGPE